MESNATTEQKAASWYSTGYAGIKREEERISQMGQPSRFFLKAGEKREVVFVDDEPLCIYEHNPRLNGDWRNWFTCLQGVYDDVACCQVLNKSYKPYYIGFYTCVDCTETVDKKGNKYQYEVKLYPAKLKTLKRLENKKKDKGGLAGRLLSVMRIDDKSPNCGDEIEVIREVDVTKLFMLANYRGKKLSEIFSKTDEESIKKLKKIFKVEVSEGKIIPKLVSFNYYDLLHPLPPKELRAILNASRIDERPEFGSSGSDSSGSVVDTDIPF